MTLHTRPCLACLVSFSTPCSRFPSSPFCSSLYSSEYKPPRRAWHPTKCLLAAPCVSLPVQASLPLPPFCSRRAIFAIHPHHPHHVAPKQVALRHHHVALNKSLHALTTCRRPQAAYHPSPRDQPSELQLTTCVSL